MRILVILLILGALGPTTKALEPQVEPLDSAYGRFAKEYPQGCDEVLAVLRSRLPKGEERLNVLGGYIQNLREDDLPRLNRAFAEKRDPKFVADLMDRLVVDIVGFRRTLDELLIDFSAKKQITLDAKLLDTLHRFWEDEYYYSYRFNDEVLTALRPST